MKEAKVALDGLEIEVEVVKNGRVHIFLETYEDGIVEHGKDGTPKMTIWVNECSINVEDL